MAIQLIDVGRVANDGTGDDLREAFIKVNQNFEEIDLRDDEQTTASNIGSVGEGIFSNKLNYDLQFKKLVSGSNINLTSTEETITLDAIGGLQQLILSSDNGSIIVSDGNTININGGAGIETSIVGNVLTIENTETELANDESPELAASLNANGNDITNVGSIDASQFNGFFKGNLEGNVWGVDIRDLNNALTNLTSGFDFSTFNRKITNYLDYVAYQTDLELGDINGAVDFTIDLGAIV